MSIRNAGAAILEARKKAGLTREQLSEGICSPQSLYRIESGSAGVSPATFQALMAHAGASREAFPVFANKADFECFLALKHTRFHLDSWQLQPAFEALRQAANLHWADNRIFYQEWLLYSVWLRLYAGSNDHAALLSVLTQALSITKPEFDFTSIDCLLLSVNELAICLFSAQEYLNLGQMDSCRTICDQIFSYIEHANLSIQEKRWLLAKYAVVFTKYLLVAGDYPSAYHTADKYRQQAITWSEDAASLELTFLTGVSLYRCGEAQKAFSFFKTAIYSAHSIGSCYATICTDYIQTSLDADFTESVKDLAPIPLPQFPPIVCIDEKTLADGTFDLSSPDVLTFGALIRMLRTEQKLSQNILCQGLCSKSALSKIENGTLQPDMMLAEALLQRLGISEREFTFWADEREAKIHELMFQIVYCDNKTPAIIESLLDELCLSMTLQDKVLHQFILFRRAILKSSNEERISLLWEALALTLPDFDITHIHEYRLSWMELSILNNLGFQYRLTDTSHSGINLLYVLHTYYTSNKLDVIFLSQTQSIMLYYFVRCLYTAKRYREIEDFFKHSSVTIMKYHLLNYGTFLFYVSQSLGECGCIEDAKSLGQYSYYLEQFLGYFKNAETLQKALLDDFSIEIG